MHLQPLNTVPVDLKTQWFVSLPIVHRALLHRRQYCIIGGLTFILIGLGGVFFSYRQIILGGIFVAAAMLWDTVAIIWMFMPCKCGQEYKLTAHTKRAAQKISLKRVLFGICLGTSVSIPVVLLLLLNIDRVFPSAFYAEFLMGLFCFIDGMLNNRLTGINKLSADNKLVEHVSSLKGENIDELSEIFDYHLKIGNYSEAERISQMSLRLAEGKSSP